MKLPKREIKFRAWDKEEKRMLVDPSIDSLGFTELATIRSIFGAEDIIFMQYTGLKDGKGKEVCEGDLFRVILGDLSFMLSGGKVGRHVERVGVVVFQSGGFVIKFRHENGELVHAPLANFLKNKQKVVIGNVFENSELLREREQEK